MKLASLAYLLVSPSLVFCFSLPRPQEESSEARTDDIPPWCNPTDPMGAWLNHQKIQAS